MIIRYYDSDLTFESSETIDYYTDYAALSAGNGAKFIAYPNQRFARALRQTQMLYIHGLGGSGLLQNENFSLNPNDAAPWVFTQQSTSDTGGLQVNPGGTGEGGYFYRMLADNSVDGETPGQLSRLVQVGSTVSAAGDSTQLRLTIVARLVDDPDRTDPGFAEKAYWYMRVGTKYYDKANDNWSDTLVWNTYTSQGIFLGGFDTFEFTTPLIPESGTVEVGVTGITGLSDIALGADYDLIRINVITAGVIDDFYATNYRGNIDTRASLVESVGTVLNADGPTTGNIARLTRDEAGTIATTSWGGTPLQDVIVSRWLGVLRANRRLIEGELIGIDALGRINRGLFYRGRFFAPVFAEWLARSRTWRVRLHEYATDETDITNNLTRENNRRNKSGDLYEQPEIGSIS